MHVYELTALDIAYLLGKCRDQETKSKGDGDASIGTSSSSTSSNVQPVIDEEDPSTSTQNAPKKTISARNTRVAQISNEEKQEQHTEQEPHSVRAFNRYRDLSGFVPFEEQKSVLFPCVVPRLAMRAVKNAYRGHFYGLKFSDDEECPEGVNPIVYFFSQNEKLKKFADFPRAKFAPGFIHPSESDIVQILFRDELTRPILNRVLGTQTQKKAMENVLKRKALSSRSSSARLEQRVVSMDIATTVRPRQRVRREDQDEDDDDDLFGQTDDDFGLDEAFLDGLCEGEVSQDDGEPTESSLTTKRPRVLPQPTSGPSQALNRLSESNEGDEKEGASTGWGRLTGNGDPRC
ncbi:hypothetical protein BGX26_001743 [Mortierella sp. AD094]|nr:hypothetical protein BGX26_001743 [Mortierella sp. AD094]